MAEILKDLALLGTGAYHDPANGYVSHSRLHDFIDRGAAFFHGRYVTGEIAKEETAALTFGQAFEDLLDLGGDGFAQSWAVRPEHIKDGRSAAAKQWAAAQEAAGKGLVSGEDYRTMLAMAASMRGKAVAQEMLKGTERQVTLRGELHGLKMQARPDRLHLSDFGTYSVDYKTCRNLSEFLAQDARPVWNFGYHTQAALVRALLAANGYENASCYLFVVEKQPSYRCAFFELKPACLAWADRLLAEECQKLKACFDTDTWPNGPDDIQSIDKPRWIRDEPPEAA